MAFITLKMRLWPLFLTPLYHTSVTPKNTMHSCPRDYAYGFFQPGIAVPTNNSDEECQIFPILHQNCSFQEVSPDHPTRSNLFLRYFHSTSLHLSFVTCHGMTHKRVMWCELALPQDCELMVNREQVCLSLCLSQGLAQYLVEISLKWIIKMAKLKIKLLWYL